MSGWNLKSCSHICRVLSWPLLSSDVNECLNQTVCGRGRCVNTEGSYRCNCFQGYTLSPDNVCHGNCQSEAQSDIINVVTALWVVLHSATTEASRHHWRFMKRVQRVSGCLYFLRPLFSSSVSSLQMWMSVCSLESVSTAAVSIWTAPTNAPVTMVTKSPQTAKPVKVCKGLFRALGLTHHCILLSWRSSLDSRIMSANYFFLLDVNECATGNACPAGICINAAGSYTCQNCRPGFGPSADGLKCEGVNSAV